MVVVGPFVGEHLDVGQTRVVIDADVGELPAGAVDPFRAIAVDAMPNPTDRSQFLARPLARRGPAFVAGSVGASSAGLPGPRALRRGTGLATCRPSAD